MPAVALIVCALGGGVAGAAPAPTTAPTEADVRSAVKRSLPYLEQGGTAWMRERKCNSCHVVTFMVWAHNEAAAAGIDVDRKKLGEWTRWALADSLSDRRWFKLRAVPAEALAAAGLPAELLPRLQPIVGKTYLTRAEYLDAVEKAIGADAIARHGDALVRLAKLPNDGGGPDTLSQLLLGRASLPAAEGLADFYGQIRSLLLEWQAPDGSWSAAGQLPAVKWGSADEMNRATSMWALLALCGEGGASAAEARRRAAEHVKGTAAGSTLQSLALELAVAHERGELERAEALYVLLMGRQNDDGGLAWWKDNKVSDAFATGQALYALGRSGHDGREPAVLRTWGYLLRSQCSDGSWNVPQEAVNTRPRKLNVYLYWGTAWADVGLLSTLPGRHVGR